MAAGPRRRRGPDDMRALGIDFGERRIGVAVSDPEGRWALPLTVVDRETDRRAVHRLADLARRERIERLVLGEPLEPDGSRGTAARRVRRFGAKLERVTGLPIEWVDETLTTVEAAERLRAAGLERPAADEPDERRENDRRRDAVAAQILLQEALDRRLSAAGASADATG